LPGSVAKGDNTGLPKETTSETPTKIEVKSHADPDENPV